MKIDIVESKENKIDLKMKKDFFFKKRNITMEAKREKRQRKYTERIPTGLKSKVNLSKKGR